VPNVGMSLWNLDGTGLSAQCWYELVELGWYRVKCPMLV
jgi:hypothetical protein